MKSGEVDAMVIHGVMTSGYMKALYPNLKDIIGNISLDEF